MTRLKRQTLNIVFFGGLAAWGIKGIAAKFGYSLGLLEMLGVAYFFGALVSWEDERGGVLDDDDE